MEVPRRIDFPSTIYLETSVKCNGQCIICPNVELDRPDMSFEMVKSVIDQCVGHTVDEVHPFQYGEPLLYPFQRETLAYIGEKLPNTKRVLFTNASVLSEDWATCLLDLGVETIRFSVDGFSKEVYEKQRPGLNFETTIANVERYLLMNEERGRPTYTGIQFTITNVNAHEQGRVVELWTPRVNEMVVHECDSRSESVGNDRVHPRYYSNPNLTAACWQPFLALSVRSNGDVSLCCIDWTPEIIVGNLYDSTVEEIWLGEELRRVQDLHLAGKKAEIPICSTCSVWN